MRVIFLLVFGLSSLLLRSQESRVNRDILEHKDGSVYIGKIIEESDWALLFWSNTTDTIEVEKSTLAMITRNANSYNPRENSNTKGKVRRGISLREPYHKTDGPFINFDMGVASGEIGTVHFGITMGKRVKPNLSLGLQLARDYTSRNNLRWVQVDGFWVVGAYGRYYFNNKKMKPFISGRIGYGSINSDFSITKKGGLNLLPGVGMHIASRGAIRFTVSVHQNIQKTSGSDRGFNDNFNNPVQVDYDIWLNRTVLKLGIEF